MGIITKERGKTITVTSDKFEVVREMMGEGRRAGRLSRGGKYYAFSSDNELTKDYIDVETAQNFNSKLSLASIVFAIKLWREGIWEVNEYMNKASSTKHIYKALVPGKNYIEEGEENEKE